MLPDTELQVWNRLTLRVFGPSLSDSHILLGTSYLGTVCDEGVDLLLGVDPLLFGEAAPVADGLEAVAAFEPYIAARLAEGVRLSSMTRHMLGLFHGRPGARAWRRHLTTESVRPGAGLAVLRDALAFVARGDEADAA